MEYIVAVAEFGNMSRAAQFCLVSQPSLAEQIAVAERTLGVQLFVRGKRRAVPTVIGEQIIAACRNAIRSVDDVLMTARLGEAVRIGAIDTVAPYLFGPWMRQLRDKGTPRLIPIQGKTRDLIEQLRDGEVDAIVIAGHAGAGFQHIALGDDPLLLATPGNERAANPAGLPDVTERDFLLLSDGHCLRENVVELCRRANVPGEQIGHLEASSIEVVVEMVANGLGSTLVPGIAASRFMARRDVKLSLFDGELSVKRPLVLCYRRDHPQHKALSEIAEIAAQTVQESTAQVVEKLTK